MEEDEEEGAVDIETSIFKQKKSELKQRPTPKAYRITPPEKKSKASELYWERKRKMEAEKEAGNGGHGLICSIMGRKTERKTERIRERVFEVREKEMGSVGENKCVYVYIGARVKMRV